MINSSFSHLMCRIQMKELEWADFNCKAFMFSVIYRCGIGFEEKKCSSCFEKAIFTLYALLTKKEKESDLKPFK